MVVRKRKKKNKLRGNRTHGKGNTKNKRGAGCRGGRGKAGSHKHKYSKYYTEFGVKKTLKPKKKGKGINLDDLNKKINEMMEKGEIEKKGEIIVINKKSFPFEKILSRGKPEFVFEVQGVKVSKKAKEKIIAKKGKIIKEKIEENMEKGEE